MKQQSEVVMNYTLLDNFKTWAYLHSTILWSIFFMQVCQLSENKNNFFSYNFQLFGSAHFGNEVKTMRSSGT